MGSCHPKPGKQQQTYRWNDKVDEHLCCWIDISKCVWLWRVPNWKESPEVEMMVTVEIAFDWLNSTSHLHIIPTFMRTSTVIAWIKCWCAIICFVLQTSKKREKQHEIQGSIYHLRQIIATENTSFGPLKGIAFWFREIPLFQWNLGWWNIIPFGKDITRVASPTLFFLINYIYMYWDRSSPIASLL